VAVQNNQNVLLLVQDLTDLPLVLIVDVMIRDVVVGALVPGVVWGELPPLQITSLYLLLLNRHLQRSSNRRLDHHIINL
jgi:hypothetical protein